ncbi:hypothetical protein SNE35_02455 [Paucibacter sp. R3-3]|uniref:DUF2442 domain-containing protein n=1 Tax=Roseateles agri TaxID=3098619 RepID=A0ABU5DAP6_9BURK|nr:hypothetical protein [Paucibacter sp. R3-3]MDY0743346.1 hypothetical protein [Paucibacter sp. R3-3]
MRISDAYLGTRQVCLRRRGEIVLCEGVPNWETGLEQLLDALESYPRERIRLWLSGGLCRPFLVACVDGVESSQEWELVAQTLAAEATGLSEPCDVWLEKVAGGQRLAVALEQSVKQQILKSFGGRLRALGPWWNEVQRTAMKKDRNLTTLVVLDCDAVTILRCDHKAPQNWMHAQSTVIGDQDALAVINRLRMGLDWPEGDDIPLVRLRAVGASPDRALPVSRDREEQAVFAQEAA